MYRPPDHIGVSAETFNRTDKVKEFLKVGQSSIDEYYPKLIKAANDYRQKMKDKHEEE